MPSKIVIKKNENRDLRTMDFDELLRTFWNESTAMRAHGLTFSERHNHACVANAASLELKTRFGYLT